MKIEEMASRPAKGAFTGEALDRYESQGEK